MRHRIAGVILALMLLTGCMTATPENTAEDGPRLLHEETLPPPTITPLILATATPSPTLDPLAPNVTPTLRLADTQRLRTPTPPDSPTPTVTDTPTRTLAPSLTRTPLPTRTDTPTATATLGPTSTLLPAQATASPTSAACMLTWFFTPAPPNCPLTAPVQTAAAIQAMERGWMIWVQSGLSIFILYTDGGQPAWSVAPDSYISEEMLSLPAPPPNLYGLQRGFGKLWGADSTIQTRLGWGITPETGYNAMIQADSLTGTRYISGPNGELFALHTGETSWRRER